MIEEYVIKELERLKDENEKLKQEIEKLKNSPIVYVDEKPIEIELIETTEIIKRLEKNNISLEDFINNMSSNEYVKIIKDLNLYKEKLNKDKKTYQGLIKINGKRIYGYENYYGGIRTDDIIYTNLDESIYYELTDNLYDIVYSEINRRKTENKGE